jgi:hypothetical protein
VDRRDPRLLGRERRGQVGRPAVDEDGALVGPDAAGEDLHERRLAGAVLPEQRAHLAGAQREDEAMERDRPGIALGQPLDGEHVGVRWSPVGARW